MPFAPQEPKRTFPNRCKQHLACTAHSVWLCNRIAWRASLLLSIIQKDRATKHSAHIAYIFKLHNVTYYILRATVMTVLAEAMFKVFSYDAVLVLTAVTEAFSFLWMLHSPSDSSSSVTVPECEPQATNLPCSWTRSAFKDSSQTWNMIKVKKNKLFFQQKKT